MHNCNSHRITGIKELTLFEPVITEDMKIK